jgi:hypothetical protein
MQSNAAIEVCIAEAEKRVDALQSLCSVFLGQVKAERRQLEKIKAALAPPVPGHEAGNQGPPGDGSLALLEG